jgi:hypothetical protein
MVHQPCFLFLLSSTASTYLLSLLREVFFSYSRNLCAQVNTTELGIILDVFEGRLARLWLEPRERQGKLDAKQNYQQKFNNAYCSLERLRPLLAHPSSCLKMDVHHCGRDSLRDRYMSPRCRSCPGLRGSRSSGSSRDLCWCILHNEGDILSRYTNTLLGQGNRDSPC